MKQLLALTMALSVFVCIAAAEDKQTQSVRPNVLFIAIDDLNSCLEGMNGETTVHTPSIIALAKRGVLFTNAHCAAPACNPSRTSVLTGVAPSNSGVYMNAQDWRENEFLKTHTTLPQHFKNSGYKTMGGGKIYHAASLSEKGYTGLLDPRPWDTYFPSKERQMPQEVLPERVPMHSSKNFYGGRFDWASLEIEPDEMADAKVVAWASQQLSQTHDKPLFLGVGIYRPHIPWYTPKKYFDQLPLADVVLPEILTDDMADVPEYPKGKLKTSWHEWLLENGQWKNFVRGYNASVGFTDDMVGRLLTALENGPLADNTVVVLWSDHGYHLGQKQHWEKFALWEQTTRVPFIIAAPGKFTVGEKCAQAVSLLDIYPTLNELCGLDSVENLDGESLVSLLKDPAQKTGRAIVTTQGRNNHAVRSQSWRYIRYADGSEELYNQGKDPKNFTNLASNPEYESCKSQLRAWLPEINAESNPKGTSSEKKEKKKPAK